MNRLLAKIPSTLAHSDGGPDCVFLSLRDRHNCNSERRRSRTSVSTIRRRQCQMQTGNSGATLGEQRLIAFQAAANIWGATLVSGPTITIRASWSATLTCGTTSGVLGSAGTTSLRANFTNAVLQNAWYSVALANALSGERFKRRDG